MLSETWIWVDQLRTTLENIGTTPCEIPQELHKLCQDIQGLFGFTLFPMGMVAMLVFIWIFF